MSLVKYFPTFV